MVVSMALRQRSEKLFAQSGRFLEYSGGLDCGCCGHLLLHATHFHTQVVGCAGDDHTLGPEFLHDDAAYLGGHALLHLQTACVEIDQPGQFAQTDGAAVGNVTDRNFTEKGSI